MQVRRDHLGVVDDERIAAAQQRRQVAHGAVLAARPARPAAPPEAARHRAAPPAAARCGPRQGKIEHVGAHGSSTLFVSLARQVARCRVLRLKRHIATFDAAINVTASAVIQVKPGIGDVIWHLPFVRAIAAASPGGCVTFLAPPSSGAQELLAAEPSVAETLYFRHSGSQLRRGFNMLLLAAQLRHRRFQQIWILDRTLRPAVAATLAGIPERIGLGLGRQRAFHHQSRHRPKPFPRSADRLAHCADGGHERAAADDGTGSAGARRNARQDRRQVRSASAALDRARHRRFAPGQGLVGFSLAGISRQFAPPLRWHGVF